MKLGDILFKVFAVIVVILANWVLFSQGCNALTEASTIYNWMGTLLIIIAVVIDIVFIVWVLRELRHTDEG